MRSQWLLLGLCVQLAGCAAVSGFPRPALNPHDEDAEVATFVGAPAIARYEACADKVACRNEIVDARLRAVDLAFYRFERKVYGQEGRVALGSDGVALALDSVATVTGTKALAAAAGAVTGSRDAYEKQVLAISLPLLFEEMIANRREILLRIRQAETTPVAGYSLFQAFSDVSEYELAGSMPAAAAELSASAGNGARAAQVKLDALRAATLAAAAAPSALPPSATPAAAP